MAESWDVVDNKYAQTYTTFSGSDIRAVFGNYEVGNIQGISLSVNREVRPVFTMGSPDARSFSRGKRGIAGSLIFTMFDRQALHDIMENAKYMARPDDADLSGDTASTSRNPKTGYTKKSPRYSDQLPPFDITLVGVNEFGLATTMSITGVHLISEGTGMSIDDQIQESQMTFVASGVSWWRPMVVSEDKSTDLWDVEEPPPSSE